MLNEISVFWMTLKVCEWMYGASKISQIPLFDVMPEWRELCLESSTFASVDYHT